MGTECWEELLLMQMEERNDGKHIKDTLRQINSFLNNLFFLEINIKFIKNFLEYWQNCGENLGLLLASNLAMLLRSNFTLGK